MNNNKWNLSALEHDTATPALPAAKPAKLDVAFDDVSYRPTLRPASPVKASPPDAVRFIISLGFLPYRGP